MLHNGPLTWALQVYVSRLISLNFSSSRPTSALILKVEVSLFFLFPFETCTFMFSRTNLTVEVFYQIKRLRFIERTLMEEITLVLIFVKLEMLNSCLSTDAELFWRHNSYVSMMFFKIRDCTLASSCLVITLVKLAAQAFTLDPVLSSSGLLKTI